MTNIHINRLPIEKVGISSSQNVYKSQEAADKKEAKSLIHYIKSNSMPSLKFTRTVSGLLEGYDENKANAPIYGNVSLEQITTIAAIREGKRVSVVGNWETAKGILDLKGYFKVTGRDDIAELFRWVPEWDGINQTEGHEILAENYKKIRVNNSMQRIARSLNLGSDEAFMFVAGDVIFWDYHRVANDFDAVNNSLVLHFNGKESIDPPVPRNYYHRLISNGKTIHFKEPNVWNFVSDFNLGLGDETYANAQNGGFGAMAFMKMTGRNMSKYHGQVEFSDVVTLLMDGL